jgi:hypothetical protein
MAKGQHLSKYQQKIVGRYYEHKDSLTTQKLQELVSDIYLASPGKEADKLWKRADAALRSAGVAPEKVEKVMASRSAEALAAMVSALTKPR